MSIVDPVARLRALAREAAQTHHYAALTDYSTEAWATHTIDFATCPHPDCVLVREAADPAADGSSPDRLE